MPVKGPSHSVGREQWVEVMCLWVFGEERFPGGIRGVSELVKN